MAVEYKFLESRKQPIKVSQERWDSIFIKKKEKKEKKSKTEKDDNGHVYYKKEYVLWLESLIGDVRINEKWRK